MKFSGAWREKGAREVFIRAGLMTRACSVESHVGGYRNSPGQAGGALITHTISLANWTIFAKRRANATALEIKNQLLLKAVLARGKGVERHKEVWELTAIA